jgi:hypothetical protein
MNQSMLSQIWMLDRGILRVVLSKQLFKLFAVSSRSKLTKQAYKFNVKEENREESVA